MPSGRARKPTQVLVEWPHMENVKIIPTYGVLTVSNRVRSITTTGDSEGVGGSGFASGSSAGGEIAFVLACTYGGALIGYFAGVFLVALLTNL